MADQTLPNQTTTREGVQAQDALRRAKYEKDILKKLDELHGVKERLYTLRYDASLSKSDAALDVQNLAREYNRIEEDIQILRKKELAHFEKSLNLPALNLEASLLTRTNKLANAIISSASIDDPSLQLNSDSRTVIEHEVMDIDDIRENEKLMRTRSTQSMSNMNAQEKWQGLFKMFKEWKFQTSTAEAQRTLATGGNPVDNEIRTLRTAIYALRQRKNLSKSDETLLQQLTIKLRGLTKIHGEMNDMNKSYDSYNTESRSSVRSPTRTPLE